MNRGINDGKDLPRDILEVAALLQNRLFIYSFKTKKREKKRKEKKRKLMEFRILNSSIVSIMQSLYESIKAEPFKIPEDDGNDLMHTFFNPDREGWLWKQGDFPS